jgi:hypothetical protein
MALIDRMGRHAARLDVLRRPLAVLAVLIAAWIAWIVLAIADREGERYLMPSLVVLVWALSACAFVVNFRRVPPAAPAGASLRTRLGRSLRRGWYRFLALLLLTTTAAAVYLSWKMLGLWLEEFGK